MRSVRITLFQPSRPEDSSGITIIYQSWLWGMGGSFGEPRYIGPTHQTCQRIERFGRRAIEACHPSIIDPAVGIVRSPCVRFAPPGRIARWQRFGGGRFMLISTTIAVRLVWVVSPFPLSLLRQIGRFPFPLLSALFQNPLRGAFRFHRRGSGVRFQK